ncbi:hypothetical protein PWT90_06217 [Aphanocladium album]|nr:hypothetical protein PWT90_06217 [Aphanocladium album]
MASAAGDFSGEASRFQALTNQFFTLISAHAGLCGPNEKEYYNCVKSIVTDIGTRLEYRFADEGPSQWKQSNVSQAEEFFRGAQEVIQGQVFRGIIETTSLGDADFPARVAVLNKFIASADSLGNNNRPPAPGQVQVRGGIPKYYGYPINRLIDETFQPAALPPWFDFSQVQRWIARCDDTHTLCKASESTKTLLSAYPTWLIDVERMCLVKGEPGLQYVCLSYLCDTECFKTTKGTLKTLQNQGSLTPPATAANANGGIPATISHAIQLAARINRRYVWVDSLCLVHDDEAQLEQDLLKMASIFGNADLTIVIPSVTAASGLSGIPDVTRPIAKRDYYRPRWWEMPNKLATRLAEHQKVLNDVSWGSPWRKRTWTFQENYFSNRFLVVDEKSMTWQCRCQVCFEDGDVGDGRESHVTHGQGLRLSHPTFKAYGELVSAVNSRQLRSPEESLHVFGGVMGVLEAHWRSGWVCGLPSQYFDLAFSWYNEKPLKKRASQNSDLMAPSWSWAAWEGPISFLDEPKGKDSITSLVQWKASSSRRTWTPLAQLNNPQGQASSGGQPGDALSDAIGALSISGSAGPQTPPVTHFTPYLLGGSVQHLSLHVMEFETAGIPLINKDGDCIGMVTPHEAITPGKKVSEVTCDVVAISELRMEGMELYNIIWVEKAGGVWYRKGVGRVVKEMWQAMKPSTLDIILG